MKKIIIILLLWLFIVNIFAVLAFNRFNLKGDTAYTWIDPNTFSQNQNWNFLNFHARWDSFWYLDIAQNGYSYKGPDKLSNIAFSPVYPLLIKGASFILFGNFILAGWLLSCLFLLLAIIYFFKLLKEFHPELNPQLPIILLLIFPTAFFFNVVYTESLFLFLSLASFYYALKKNFVLAGILGFFASLTRITGILIFIPLFWEYIQNYGFRKIFNNKFLSLLFVPLGTLSFFFYHYLKFGDFFLLLKVEASWGRAFKFNQDHFALFSNAAVANFLVDILFLVAILIITFFVFKKLRTSYGLYMLATLLLALGTGTTMSIGRYILVLFPAYILVSQIKNKYLQQAWIFASILLLAMNITLFVNNYWAG